MASENAIGITNNLETGFRVTIKFIETVDQIASQTVVIGETAKALDTLFTSTNKQ